MPGSASSSADFLRRHADLSSTLADLSGAAAVVAGHRAPPHPWRISTHHQRRQLALWPCGRRVGRPSLVFDVLLFTSVDVRRRHFFLYPSGVVHARLCYLLCTMLLFCQFGGAIGWCWAVLLGLLLSGLLKGCCGLLVVVLLLGCTAGLLWVAGCCCG